ncbi:transposase zinc-binding domain-containing protein [Brevibacillus sp. 179-C9.3 HS]|uniref:transposase zinc-binding domain-containing protein n=1 Tax=unclassified Brevibacillus TaxID=2684853 RepID=UPI0039A34440
MKIWRQTFLDGSFSWDHFVKKHGKKIRPVVFREVMKFRDCGNPRNGFKLFVCEGCHDVKRVPYRCKRRFVPCGCSGEKNISSLGSRLRPAGKCALPAPKDSTSRYVWKYSSLE